MHPAGAPLPSVLRGKLWLCVLQTVDPPNHVLTPNPAPALPSMVWVKGMAPLQPLTQRRRGDCSKSWPGLQRASAVLPPWPCEWPSALGWKRSKGFKESGLSESVLAWFPPLTLPRQKLSHPFNSTLSGRRTRSVLWQVERAGPQPYPRMLGHAQLGAVLEGATSFQALLERHPSSFPWLTPKGQKACQETPGSGLGLLVSFPAVFIRSSLCTLPVRTKQRCYGNCKHQAILAPALGSPAQRDNGFCCYLLDAEAQSVVPSGPN